MRLLALVGCALAMTACTSTRVHVTQTTIVSTQTQVVTGTRTSTAPVYSPAPATSVPGLRPGQQRRGEKNARCPYIRTGLNQDPANGSDQNVADIEGDRVYRTTVLTTLRPVGCRFYFIYGDYQAVADILPSTFATASAAHNALISTAAAGSHLEVMKGFAPGVDGIGYQTRFYGPDDADDWAFAFAKGKVLVVVHTQQDNSPLNAQLLAKAIVGKF